MDKKILLIEDNFEVRENIAEILSLANFEVVEAENGKVGVDQAKRHIPDLILCDIMMPELDGYGVLYLLSRDPQTASIPFIFLTAKAERSDLRKGMNLGADDYLTKPFEEIELLNAIESRLKRSDSFKANFENNIDGLSNFLDKARGLEELEKLSENRKPRVYKKKESIFREGDFPSGLYFVCKGKVKTLKMNEDGKEFVTGLFKEGDFIGYMELFQEEEYTESAIVIEDASLYKIPKEDFLSLLYTNRDVSNKFIKLLSGSLIEKEKELLTLAYDSVRKRVAIALVHLRERFKNSENEDFSMSIARDDLASMVGTSTESVIRTLSDFKEEQLIEIKGSKIKILNPNGLAGLKH